MKHSSEKNNLRSSTLVIAVSALLAACGGGGGGGSAPPRFETTSVSGTPAIRDNTTGIVWAGVLGIDGLPVGNSEPTVAELLELTDLGESTLQPHFGFVLGDRLIKASDPLNGLDGRVWAVDFGSRAMGSLSDEATATLPDFSNWRILSRRSNALPAPVSYSSDNYYGTVTGNGLTWKVCSEGRSWQWPSSRCTGSVNTVVAVEAQSFANSANASRYAGFNDWRVPSQQELRSLLQVQNALSYSLQPTQFAPDALNVGVPAVYWSSGRVPDNSRAWMVDFSGGTDPGGVEAVDLGELAHVRLVRTVR